MSTSLDIFGLVARKMPTNGRAQISTNAQPDAPYVANTSLPPLDLTTSYNTYPQNHQPPRLPTPPKQHTQPQKQQPILQILQQCRIPRLLCQFLRTPTQQLLPSRVRPDEFAGCDAARFVDE